MLLRQLSDDVKTQLKASKASTRLAFHWGSNALKGSIIGAGVRNIIALLHSVPQSSHPGEVDVVDGSPEPRQDWRPVERPVPHHVELLSRPQPGGDCGLLPLTEETVRVSTAEDLHGGVGERLEPPESSNRELSVEVSYPGKFSRVTEVNKAVVTVELTEEVQGLGVLAGHIVVDPQPPPREQPPGRLGQWLEQAQEPLHGVGGLSVVQVPGGRIQVGGLLD